MVRVPPGALPKLYVVIDGQLRGGSRIAQAVHAALDHAVAFPEEVAAWHRNSNTLVVLESTDLQGISDRIGCRKFRRTEFREPDLDDRLTAIAAEPAAGRWLSDLRLAR